MSISSVMRDVNNRPVEIVLVWECQVFCPKSPLLSLAELMVIRKGFQL